MEKEGDLVEDPGKRESQIRQEGRGEGVACLAAPLGDPLVALIGHAVDLDGFKLSKILQPPAFNLITCWFPQV